MATKIVTKNSSTASAVPTASDLVQGELAVNVADKRLFTEDNAGAIVELGVNPAAEITANAGIALPDSQKATFGAGDDLQIYHDGSDSFVSDVGTGDLYLQGSSNIYFRKGNGGEVFAHFADDGACKLRFDNSTKLATTSTGIDVTGTATMDGLTVSSDTNGDPVLAHLYNTSTGASAEATAYITNSATSSDGLFLQATGASFTTIGGFVQDAAVLGSGTGASGGLSIMTRANADMRFYTNGHTNERMRIDSSGNLLVGTSQNNPTSSGVNVAGQEFSTTGGVRSTVASNAAATFNRKTDDGAIALFRKNGTTVGSIGTSGGDLTIGNGSTVGLIFEQTGSDRISPWNLTTNATRDGEIDLGDSNQRFKDLYLSGGISTNTATGLSITANATNRGILNLSTSTAYQLIGGSYYGYTGYKTGGYHRWFGSDGGEDMRIDSSGILLVGKPSDANTANGVTLRPDGGGRFTAAGTSSFVQLAFFRNGSASEVGSILTTSSATTYATSSDYRLKENVVPMTGSIDRVKALKPSRFNFIVDPDNTVDGFLAHEAQAVVPECVTGSKDAMRDEEYEVTAAVEEVRDGDDNITTEAVEAVMGTRSVPDMQGIDQSKLVPLLTAALQEAITQIESLTARITALENN